MKKTSGIYQIKNCATGKLYVGSAVNIRMRWNQHVFDLRNGKHHSIALQRAWNKYGKAEFVFSILEVVEEKNLLIHREQHWIDSLNVIAPNGYNICPTAGSNLGRVFSSEARKNMSAASMGRRHSVESRKKISDAGKRACNEETKEKISASNKGKKRSEEERLRRSAIAKNISDETRLKMSAASKGRTASVEAKEKMSAFQKGRKKSDAHKAKIGASNKGKRKSEESKKKVSESKSGVPWSAAKRLSYEAKYLVKIQVPA